MATTTIGRLNFLVSADSTGVNFRPAQKAISDLSASVVHIGVVVGAAATAAGASIVALVSHFASVGDKLGEMSARTGVAGSTLAEFGAIASQIGGDLESVEVSIKKMQKVLGSAFEGDSGATDTIAKLGLSLQSLAQMNPEQQFEAMAEAIGGIQNPTQRAAAALEVFGKSGTILLPMLANLRALREEAKAEGLIPSEKSIAAAGRIADAFDKLKLKISAMWFDLGAAFAPAIEPVITALFDAAGKVQQLVSDNAVEIAKWSAAIGEMVATGVEKLGDLITWFGNLDAGTAQTTVKILAMTAAFAATIAIVPKIVAAGAAIVKVLRSISIGQSIAQALSGPSGLATLAVGLAAAVGAGAAVNAMFDGVANAAERTTGKVSETRKAIKDVFAGAEITDGGEGLKSQLKALGDEAREVKKHFDDMRRNVEGRRGVFTSALERGAVGTAEGLARAGQEGLIQKELQRLREQELAQLKRIEEREKEVKDAIEKKQPITVTERRI